MAIQIQLRRGTALEWTNANTILSIGEIGVEHDTGKFKLGNGTSNWNSLQYFTTIVTGSSYPITSSWATNVISSSFSTTASYTLNTISASYSLTASYALNGGSSGSGGTTLTTGSTYPITSSWSLYSLTASYALNAGSGSGTTLTTGSTYPITSSWSNNSLTASYLNPISQSLIPSTGSTYSLGSPTNKWKDLYVSSGSIYIGETVLSTSGSTLFVNSSPAVTLNTASGQLEVGGFTASLSSSYSSTASVALTSLTSSYSLNSVSSSYALTASFSLNGGSSGSSGIEGGGLFTVTSDGFNYNIAGYSGAFPTITLARGQLYYFNVSGVSASHPFALRLSSGNTSAVSGSTNNDPVNGLANTSTLIIYRVPNDAPSSIVYQCVIHSGMIGTINIVDQYGTTLTTGSSYPITSSWSNNATSASYALNARSSSFAVTSSYVISASAAESFHPFMLA